jgi:hypothetical protein
MDTYRSNHDQEQELDGGFAYQSGELPTAVPAQSRLSSSGFGFGLLKALRMHGQPAAPQPVIDTDEVEQAQAAEFAGFVSNSPAKVYSDPTPVYRGEYNNLCPLYFNTEPVDNANDTRLERSKISTYTRAQLFFLLRLERFLRLRHYWLKASPRQDEAWKTDLVLRGVFSALEDCIEHEVGADAKVLLQKWGC